MKQFIVFAISSFMLFGHSVSAQSDEQIKLENLRYYLYSIKENTQAMRYYTDSVKMITLLDELDVLTAALDEELNKVVIPEEVIFQEEPDTTGEIISEQNFENVWTNAKPEEEEQTSGDTGLSKFLPFKNKFNTNLKIQFGINTLDKQVTNFTGNVPDINTGGSWYWDFTLSRTARLGGNKSKVAVNYGIGYLINRFKIENDLRLSSTDDNQPIFVTTENLRSNPKLNIGYLNIPLSITFALSKKTKLELGGYAGYRIQTVQKIHIKTAKETVHEYHYARHHLNNWMYGVSLGLDISGFDIIARYNFSGLFQDDNRFDFNTFMLGTSFSLF